MVVPASTTFAVITGGGTSGHVVPAMAIAELLVDAGHDMTTLHYVGSNRGAEVAMIPPLGLAHTFLAVDGLQRGVSLSKVKRNVLMVPTMLRALGRAKSLLKRLKPQVVISVGGYASIPTCRAARDLGIPVVTCSYDRRPGLATKLQSRYAAASAVAYAPSKLRNAVETGAPVRRNLRSADVHALRVSARESLGISASARVAVVMGGSLGSAVLNSATEHLVQSLRSTEHTCIIHIAGERFMDAVKLPVTMHHSNGSLSYSRIAYSNDMITMYAAADVVVCRAGASTIAITASGSPLAQAVQVHIPADHGEYYEQYSPMVSRLLHLCIVDVLATQVAIQLGDSVQKNMARLKKNLIDSRYVK